MVRLLGDGEVTIAFAFNPAEFSNAISQQILPDTVRSYIHEQGTLANIHFVAIPFNASAPEGAMLVADFLLSFDAQLRKANSGFGEILRCCHLANLMTSKSSNSMPCRAALPACQRLSYLLRLQSLTLTG